MDPVTRSLWKRQLQRPLLVEQDGESLCYPPWIFGAFLKVSGTQKVLVEAHYLRLLQLVTWSMLATIAVFLAALRFVSLIEALVLVLLIWLSIIAILVVYNGKVISALTSGAEKSTTKFNLDFLAARSGHVPMSQIVTGIASLILIMVAGLIVGFTVLRDQNPLFLVLILVAELLFLIPLLLWIKIFLREWHSPNNT